MTEHEAAAALFQLAFRLQTRLRILAARFARALLRHFTLVSKRAQGRPGAGWHPRPLREKHTQENRTAAYRCSQSLGLPCAMVGRLMPCSPGSRVPSGLPRLANWMMLSARLGSHTPPRKLDRSNDGQDHTSIFWHSVKHAETNKRLQNKRFSTTLMQAVSAGFTKLRARP